MSLADSNAGLSAADIAAVMGNNCNGWGFGNNGDWWVILFLFAMMGNGFGGWGMNGFGGGMYEFPWLLNGQNQINANTNAGFDQAATQRAIGDLNNNVIAGFGDVQTALCGGFAGVNATINGAQNAVSQQMYTNQIADMERSFNAQTAVTSGLTNLSSQLAQCCCDNRAATQDVKFTIAQEECATRQNSTANTQAILDKLCQLELDGYKRENDQLRSQLQFSNLQSSQIAQTAEILQGQNAEVDALYNRLSNCPVPSTPVYGRTPIFTCNNNSCACGFAG